VGSLCGEELPGDSLIVSNPVIIVEVLSPTTMHTDTSAKLIGYFKLPSVQHYLIIDPDTGSVAHHTRSANGSVSASHMTSGAFQLDPPGLTVELSEFFA
jgi:Uma2 family endonuclease